MNRTLNYLLNRRSVKARNLTEPGPDEQQIKQMMTVATRVPDHGKLAPWRIYLLDRSAQCQLGERLTARFVVLNPDANEKQQEHERMRPQQAPLLAIIAFCPQIGRIPVWEQQLSTGAVCMNLIHACHAMGFAANWLTEWPSYDAEVKQWFDLGADDQLAGFIYIGTATEKPEERERPALDDVVLRWGGNGR